MLLAVVAVFVFATLVTPTAQTTDEEARFQVCATNMQEKLKGYISIKTVFTKYLLAGVSDIRTPEGIKEFIEAKLGFKIKEEHIVAGMDQYSTISNDTLDKLFKEADSDEDGFLNLEELSVGFLKIIASSLYYMANAAKLAGTNLLTTDEGMDPDYNYNSHVKKYYDNMAKLEGIIPYNSVALMTGFKAMKTDIEIARDKTPLNEIFDKSKSMRNFFNNYLNHTWTAPPVIFGSTLHVLKFLNIPVPTIADVDEDGNEQLTEDEIYKWYFAQNPTGIRPFSC